jgi:hypothetical protein
MVPVVTSLHRKLLKCPLQNFATKLKKTKGIDWYRKISCLDPFNDPADPDLLIEKPQICPVRKRKKIYKNESTGVSESAFDFGNQTRFIRRPRSSTKKGNAF